MRITLDVYTYPQNDEIEKKLESNFGYVATADLLAQEVLLLLYNTPDIKEAVRKAKVSLVVRLQDVENGKTNRVHPAEQKVGCFWFPHHII